MGPLAALVLLTLVAVPTVHAETAPDDGHDIKDAVQHAHDVMARIRAEVERHKDDPAPQPLADTTEPEENPLARQLEERLQRAMEMGKSMGKEALTEHVRAQAEKHFEETAHLRDEHGGFAGGEGTPARNHTKNRFKAARRRQRPQQRAEFMLATSVEEAEEMSHTRALTTEETYAFAQTAMGSMAPYLDEMAPGFSYFMANYLVSDPIDITEDFMMSVVFPVYLVKHLTQRFTDRVTPELHHSCFQTLQQTLHYQLVNQISPRVGHTLTRTIGFPLYSELTSILTHTLTPGLTETLTQTLTHFMIEFHFHYDYSRYMQCYYHWYECKIVKEGTDPHCEIPEFCTKHFLMKEGWLRNSVADNNVHPKWEETEKKKEAEDALPHSHKP